MKILRVVSDLYPEVVGGLGIHAHEMSKEQVKLGHDVTVYTSLSGESKNKEVRDGYKIERFKDHRVMGNSISMPLFSRLRDKRNDFDIVHAHSHLFFSTFLCAAIRNRGSTPLVVTNHGLISQTVPLWINNSYNHVVAKRIFNASDKVICYTEEEKSRVIKLGVDPEKVEVIHNGINTELFTPKPNKEKTNQLLWIGRFIQGKGVKYLINAFKLVLDQHPHLKLLMVGKGPLKEDIEEKIIQLGLQDNVTIKEFVPNSEILKLYQNSDVFVLPSLEEGVPRTILESMSCGVPVVCTELPQLLNIVKGCGITVPTKDSHALAEAIIKLVDDEDLSRKLGKNGREKVYKDYSWEDTVKKTVKLYEKLI